MFSRSAFPRPPHLAVIAVAVQALGVALGCRSTSLERPKEVTPSDLAVSVDSEPKEGFDPVKGWGHYGSPLFQSTLFRRNREHALVPDLAESAELSEDRLTWKIRIRNDALFHDGVPVKADDVVFTFKQASQAGGKVDMTALREAVVTGPDALELRLREPQITFVNRLVTLGIVPAHAYGEGYGRNPIGSGPYRLVRWDEGRQMVMEAHARYYGEKARIGRVTFLYLDEDAAFAAVRAGTLHVVRVPAALAARKVPGMRVVAVKSVDNRGISFPCVPHQAKTAPGEAEVGNDVTASLAVRQAINIAVNRATLVTGVLEGFGSPAFGPVHYLPWDEPEGAVVDSQLEGARRLLESDGWKDQDGDGVREKDGQSAAFTLLYPADDLTRQGLAMSVADMLRPVGIRATVAARSWEDIYRLMHSTPVLFGFGSFDQTEMHNLFYGKRQSAAIYNAGLYQNSRVDQYLERAMAAHSETDAIDFWKRAQWDGETGFSARADAPWAWLVNLDHVYLVDERLDIGTPEIEQHGTNIMANAHQWQWRGAP